MVINRSDSSLKRFEEVHLCIKCLWFQIFFVCLFIVTQASSLTGPAKALSSLSVPAQPADLLPGASPRKKPRKQQHVISTEETEMMETNSTDEERAISRGAGNRPGRRESPPREYVGGFFNLRGLSPRNLSLDGYFSALIASRISFILVSFYFYFSTKIYMHIFREETNI